MKSIHRLGVVRLGAGAIGLAMLLAFASAAQARPAPCKLTKAPLPPHDVQVHVTNDSATVISLQFSVTPLSWACGWLPIGNPSAVENETLLLGQNWFTRYASSSQALFLTIRANGITTRNAVTYCAENSMVNGALDSLNITITGSTVGITCKMPSNAFVADPVTGSGTQFPVAPPS